MNFFGKRVLFLGAHPDDIELGCGALLHHVKQTDVLCVTLSDNQKNPDLVNVKKEHFESMAVLGIPSEKIVLGPFTTRVFPDARLLLKNENQALPLAKDTPLILVAGQAADDIGLQCGGWTIEWLGKSGYITLGTTILEGIRAAISPTTRIEYDSTGNFNHLVTASGEPVKAEAGILLLAEEPYAEGFGDRADLTLSTEDVRLIERLRLRCHQLVVILITGRPLIVTDQLPLIDALVVAWLPGTEGQGVADVLFGDKKFTERLSFTWPRGMEQIPIVFPFPQGEGAEPLFPFGYGLQA